MEEKAQRARKKSDKQNKSNGIGQELLDHEAVLMTAGTRPQCPRNTTPSVWCWAYWLRSRWRTSGAGLFYGICGIESFFYLAFAL